MKGFRKALEVVISISVLTALWELIALAGRFEKSLFPSPAAVLAGISELVEDQTLFANIKVSLVRFFTGYLSAVAAGIGLGLLLGWNKSIWAFVDPVVQILRPISPIAWFPFIVLWFGIGDAPAVVIIFIAAFFPVLLSTVSGVGNVDLIYLKVAENFGIKEPRLLFKIILPAAFPMIVNGLHLALGSAWVFLVAGEMVGAQSGLGFMIIDARNSLRTDLVLAGIIIIGLLGFLLDRLIRILEDRIKSRWMALPGVED
ncbi:ABC transporter permease [Thermoclostridium stercorarium]|mgnify:CR=1 FL=1|jgi:NitT/TauT family transport system permease protein|uniref:Sulfonate ABC transporter permease n=1 Tax=Thermoclostridium stercorarium subsp. leptospartum DSM 9219 TaxID=1346611 RepID=A0A1B1YM51_THEST|nr:ABC transporter permease [Thermoclostridium stercorarium]ANX01869.1 sulfonate ABC transporter permease [Thermoclostridium stercorarium subsp. leptospartum DSM 9219]UZQ84920.1 ABC transporter permease [Thermoclostridium stercorarium]